MAFDVEVSYYIMSRLTFRRGNARLKRPQGKIPGKFQGNSRKAPPHVVTSVRKPRALYVCRRCCFFGKKKSVYKQNTKKSIGVGRVPNNCRDRDLCIYCCIWCDRTPSCICVCVCVLACSTDDIASHVSTQKQIGVVQKMDRPWRRHPHRDEGLLYQVQMCVCRSHLFPGHLPGTLGRFADPGSHALLVDFISETTTVRQRPNLVQGLGGNHCQVFV